MAEGSETVLLGDLCLQPKDKKSFCCYRTTHVGHSYWSQIFLHVLLPYDMRSSIFFFRST